MSKEELENRVIDVTPEKRGVGRPKGAKNKSTLFKEIIAANVEKIAGEEFEKVVSKTFELAQDGDTTCMKILWDKFYASQKAIDGETGGTPLVNITIKGIEPESLVIDGEESAD